MNTNCYLHDKRSRVKTKSANHRNSTQFWKKHDLQQDPRLFEVKFLPVRNHVCAEGILSTLNHIAE